jgi:hypothetical protein
VTAAPSTRGVLPLYAFALFVSALLAFWIQPLIAKLLLPHYGGSPAVWTTTALFFQVMLLAGYLYAHLVTRLQPRAQAVLHTAVLIAGLSALPFSASTGFAAASPVFSLLAALAVSVGFPMFALSATAPLLQQWFSRSGHRHAPDPYFLYSASNAGSLAALIGYPLLLEPLLGLREQTLAWSVMCGVSAALVLACGVAVWRSAASGGSVPHRTLAPAASLQWRVRGRWFLLAFAPSSLMLGVTQHITSEIAAAPLLWLIPLTIYILTFIVAFAALGARIAGSINRAQPMLVLLLALVWPLNTSASVLILHLVVFAVTAMMCHAELARTRPDTRHLTSFYLWLAIGGAAGGAFNALIAPVVFSSILEYPLALALACALRPLPAQPHLHASWKDVAPAAALGACFAALIHTGFRPFTHGWTTVVYLQAVGITLYLTWRRPRQFALAVLVVLIATPAVHMAERLLERHRSFFGVHGVLRDDTGQFNVLMHGITVHGAQYIDPAKRLKPTAYYHADSPIGHVFSVLGKNDALKRVAVVGMGLGTLACHRAAGREWTFYEIDPIVVRLAQDERYFDFLARCAPGARIEIGDGRLTLAKAPPGSFDLIVIDTFSSDSIPAHMITREALALYASRLAKGGVIAFHVTNDYLDLVPVLGRLALDAHLAAYVPGLRFEIALEERLAALPSSWVVMARDAARLAPLDAAEGWVPLPPPSPGRVWTDDFSNVPGALK